MNPFQLLLRSRKFWLLVLDVVISTIVLVISTYFKASADFILKIIAIYQPVFVFIITAIAYEDGKKIESGNLPGQ